MSFLIVRSVNSYRSGVVICRQVFTIVNLTSVLFSSCLLSSLQRPAFSASSEHEVEEQINSSISPQDSTAATYLAQQALPQIPSLEPSQPFPFGIDGPENRLESLPPPEELLKPADEESPPPFTTDPSPSLDETTPESFIVQRFQFVGNTVFGDDELSQLLEPYIGRPLEFIELIQARSVITDYYVSKGYVTSGAFIPADQIVEEGTVTIAIIEGRLANVNIEGLQRINPGYIVSRINIASGPPLNLNDILEALQLLQIDPLIENLSAELVATPNAGENNLNLVVQEAQTFTLDVDLNNSQIPLVGTIQANAVLAENNLLGIGDRLSFRYGVTSGSDTLNVDYSIPVNPYNGKLRLGYETSSNKAVTFPFNLIGLRSNSEQWRIGFSQPVVQTISDEISLGIAVAHSFNQTSISPPGLPQENFPILPGANRDGVTRTSTLLFSQDWIHRTTQQVIGLRSQFGIGTNWFNATVNSGDVPDSNFFTWQGQFQWVQRFNNENLLIVRSAAQLADRPLLPRQQFGIGGPTSVRGYQTDQTLTDNGFWLSLEAQFPFMTIPEIESEFRFAPFVDYGKPWNNGVGREPSISNLASVGIGTIWQIEDRMFARLDWGIPLNPVSSRESFLQQSNLNFSVVLSLF